MNNKEIYFTIKKTTNNGYDRFRIQKMVDGKQINVVGKSKKEVTEKFYKKLDELSRSNSISINVKAITFSDFVHYYLYEVVEPTKSVKGSTFLTYEAFYTSHIKNSHLENVKLINMNRENIQKFINNLLQKKLKLSSIVTIKTFVSTVLNYAVSGDLIDKNYCRYVKVPKEEKKEVHKFLTDAEIKSLLLNCDDYNFKVLILLILNTGLRINEALALTVADVDFELKYINVNKTIQSTNKGLVIGSPKTKTSNRKIPLNNELLVTLKKYITAIKETRLKFGIAVNDDSLLFLSNNNSLIYHTSYSKKLNALYKKSNVKASGFHILRHTFGSKLYQNNVDIKTISELLGHSNISITSDIYIHLSPEAKVNAVELLNFNF